MDRGGAPVTLKTLAALLTTMLFWGSSFVATKLVLAAWPSWAYMFLRFFLASLIFLVLLIRKKALRIPRHLVPRLILISVFEPGLYFLFETLGLERTSAASSSIIIAAIPAVVALFSAIFLNERLNARGWIGTLLSIIGIAIITLFATGSGNDPTTLMGNVFILLAVFSATGYIVMARSISSEISPLQLTAYQSFFAAVAFFPGLILQGRELMSAAFDPMLIAALAFLVICATVAAFLAYNYALSQISAPRAAVFINGIPVVTVIVAWIVLGERLNGMQMIGGALAIGGLMLANRRETARLNMEA
jgi:drug/metabolite transporter (DMT)-like permease